MPKEILIEFNGKVANIKDHCREIGINYGTLASRHQKTGKLYLECLEYYTNNSVKPKQLSFNYNGNVLNLREYCEKLGLNYHSVLGYKYKHKDLSYDEVIANCLANKNKRKIKHKKLYEKYQSMLDRCYNPKNIRYHRYGGREIKVCDRWLNSYFNFEDDLQESFLAHLEKYGIKDTTLDRWPNRNGNYTIDNVRWATREEQANNKDINISFPCGQSLYSVCKRINKNYNTIRGRLRSGWTLEEALLVPIASKPVDHKDTIKYRCAEIGLNYNTYQQRRKAGKSKEEALTLPLNKHNYKYFLSTGEPLDLFCKRNNLPCETIRKRIRRGQSVDEAILKYIKKHNIEVTYEY